MSAQQELTSSTSSTTIASNADVVDSSNFKGDPHENVVSSNSGESCVTRGHPKTRNASGDDQKSLPSASSSSGDDGGQDLTTKQPFNSAITTTNVDGRRVPLSQSEGVSASAEMPQSTDQPQKEGKGDEVKPSASKVDSSAVSETTSTSSPPRGHKRRAAQSDVSSSSNTSSKGSSPSSSETSKKEEKGGRKHRHHHKSRRGSSSPTSAKKTRSSASDKMTSSSNNNNNSSDSDDDRRMMIDEDAGDEDTREASSRSSPATSANQQLQVMETTSSKPGSPTNGTGSGEAAPKVPPLRIVISKSTSNSSSSTSVVTTAGDNNSLSQKVSSTSSSSGGSSKASHLAVSSSGRDKDEQDGPSDDDASNTSAASGPTESKTMSSGRVTRSSQRVKDQQQNQDHGSSSTTSTRSHHNLRDRGRDKDDEESRDVTSPISSCSKDSKGNEELSMAQTQPGKEGRKRKVRAGKASANSGPTSEKVTRSSEKNLRSSDNHRVEQNVDNEDNESTSSSTSSTGGTKDTSTSNSTTTTSSDNGTTNMAKNSNGNGNKEFTVPSYNSYQMYLNIRRAIEKRRKNLVPVQPNPPKGFKDYLMIKGGYILKDTVTSQPSTGYNNSSPKLPTMKLPPSSLLPGSDLYTLFCDQEKERHRMRIQHQIEKEKLRLNLEQEILRVHGRAALAVANQTIPYSFCSIIKDEEIYNMIDPENENSTTESTEGGGPPRVEGESGRPSSSGSSKNEYSKNTYTNSASSSTDLTVLTGGPSAPGSRSRYNGRLFLSWIQDVTDKWDKIKNETILRQRRESESLLAVQKLDWEWKMKELLLCDFKSTPVIDKTLIPPVEVLDDFDPLPST